MNCTKLKKDTGLVSLCQNILFCLEIESSTASVYPYLKEIPDRDVVRPLTKGFVNLHLTTLQSSLIQNNTKCPYFTVKKMLIPSSSKLSQLFSQKIFSLKIKRFQSLMEYCKMMLKKYSTVFPFDNCRCKREHPYQWLSCNQR